MKKLLFLLILIPGILNAQLNIRIADSRLKGLVGLEYQFSNLSLSAGWKPSRVSVYTPNEWQNCYSVAATYYHNVRTSSPYISMGVTDKGSSAYNIETYEYDIFPALFIMGGVRCYPHDYSYRFTDRVFFDCGLGAKFSQIGIQGTLEFVINFMLYDPRRN